MPLYLNEDQTMLLESASEFMKTEGPVAHLRALRDENCKDGFSRALWKQFGEMGFTGVLVGEEDGGLGLGQVEAGVILEQIGRNLTPSPFLTTAVVGVEALNRAGKTLRDRYIPGILNGETVLALALEEGAKHRPDRIETRAERSGNGFKITGRKQFVVHGASADALIVIARTSGSANDANGLTAFVMDKEAAGLVVDPTRLVDSTMAAHVTFDNVTVDADAVIGEVDQGGDVLKAFLRAGRVGCAAEQLGVGGGAMDMTVNYLKERKQFGRFIGEFQALQHRAAHLYSEMEIARAAVLKAAQLLDEGAENADLYVSVAKAKTSRVTNLAVREGVQMHGGMGMTDEFDIGLYMKRERGLTEFLGDANYHANQVALLHGY
jgi:alkylation response protein AidB-like acyl-CoA dehydrogenase